jgi:hypothetical protein
VIAAAIGLTLAAVASAKPRWIDGRMVRSDVVSCRTATLGNPVVTAGVLAQVGFRADPAALPRIGQTFYARVFIGGAGEPCVTQFASVEVVLPVGVKLAVTRRTPIRCSSFRVNPSTKPVPAAGCPRTASRGTRGWQFVRTTRADGLWALPRGQAYFIDFPLRSTRVLKGIARGLPACRRVPCTPAQARDNLQVALKISDGNANPWLVPYVGLFVRK